MTKRVLIEARELEKAAEQAGGYVSPPWALPENPKGESEFSKIRQYSIEHKKPISKLSSEDYRKMGITPHDNA